MENNNENILDNLENYVFSENGFATSSDAVAFLNSDLSTGSLLSEDLNLSNQNMQSAAAENSISAKEPEQYVEQRAKYTEGAISTLETVFEETQVSYQPRINSRIMQPPSQMLRLAPSSDFSAFSPMIPRENTGESSTMEGQNSYNCHTYPFLSNVSNLPNQDRQSAAVKNDISAKELEQYMEQGAKYTDEAMSTSEIVFEKTQGSHQPGIDFRISQTPSQLLHLEPSNDFNASSPMTLRKFTSISITMEGQISYNCLDCKRHFASLGFLKRHYNSAIHKNMVLKNSAKSHQTTNSNGAAKHLHLNGDMRGMSSSIGDLDGSQTDMQLTHQRGFGLETTGNRLEGDSGSGTCKHECDQCNMYFSKQCYLRQHRKSIHDGDKPFRCVKCGKRFSSEEVLQKHVERHWRDKPFKCVHCFRTFNYKWDLTRHMYHHTDTKPHHCPICGKGYSRGDHMRRHTLTHGK